MKIFVLYISQLKTKRNKILHDIRKLVQENASVAIGRPGQRDWATIWLRKCFVLSDCCVEKASTPMYRPLQHRPKY